MQSRGREADTEVVKLRLRTLGPTHRAKDTNPHDANIGCSCLVCSQLTLKALNGTDCGSRHTAGLPPSASDVTDSILKPFFQATFPKKKLSPGNRNLLLSKLIGQTACSTLHVVFSPLLCTHTHTLLCQRAMCLICQGLWPRCGNQVTMCSRDFYPRECS